MNNLMIFENKEVEVFELNGQVLFNPKDVAECLDIKNVNDNLRTMTEKQVIKLTNSIIGSTDFRKLHNTGENFLTESGVYKLIFKSRKPEAEKFQDWVTDEVLPTIRKTGKFDGALPKTQEEIMIWQLKEQQKIKQQLNEVNHHMLRTTNEVEKLEEDFRVYKDEDTLRVVECEEISDLVKKTGVRVLGGKGSKAYKDKGLRMKVFKNIWAEVRNQFDVNKYKQIKRKHFEKAKEIVRDYKITFALEEEIKITNNQFSF